MQPVLNKFIPVLAIFILTLLTLTPMQAFKVVCKNCMEASAGCIDCKRIKVRGPSLDWKIPIENRTPAQSEDRIVGQMQTPEELAGYKKRSVSRRDDDLEKVYSCEDSLPIGSPLRATGIIVRASNEEQFKKEKWHFSRASIQMIDECHALTVAHAMFDSKTYDDLIPFTPNSNLHDDKLKQKKQDINEGLKNRSGTDVAYRVCIKRKSNSMSFDTEQCDKVEKVVALDLSPDKDLAVVRLAKCRGADPTVGRFYLPTPREVYDYLMKDKSIRSNLPLAFTSFAADRHGCSLSVDTCSPGPKEFHSRLTGMGCNNVPGQSGGALSIVLDREGKLVSQDKIREAPDSPNFQFKIIGLSQGVKVDETQKINIEDSDTFAVTHSFKNKTIDESSNRYIEFLRADVSILNDAIAQDYEENKAQLDANIALMKKQGEAQLAEEERLQNKRSRNKYSSARKPGEEI